MRYQTALHSVTRRRAYSRRFSILQAAMAALLSHFVGFRRAGRDGSGLRQFAKGELQPCVTNHDPAKTSSSAAWSPESCLSASSVSS
ncbi:hypothetical protein MPLA_1800157 [Mesorhizobium sp. ORS 3359]|nr:hypothetical protein MPLA_1800157 [Mesorhizobium sp. ORS 3359]